MAIRYLRRPPKRTSQKADVNKGKRTLIKPVHSAPAEQPLQITPDERVALAESLAYFCVACGREHASGNIRHGDIACAEAEIASVISRVQ